MNNDKRFSFLMDDDDLSQPLDQSSTATHSSNRWSLLGGDDMQSKNEPAIVEESFEKKEGALFKEGESIYRSEQLTVIKLDGIIENHAETKLEYHIKKYVTNNQYMVDVVLTDSVLTVQPSYLQDSSNVLSEIDRIKSNVSVVVDKTTGKIKSITNMDAIRQKWMAFKQKIQDNTSFLKTPEIRKNLELYLTETEKQINEESILLELKTRPFFELFFDTYLVSSNLSFNPYRKLYYSQLFDRLPVDFDVTQMVLNETPSHINISKQAKLNGNSPHIKDFERIYDHRYKPKIGYMFSEYNYEHNTDAVYNWDNNLLDGASMRITEEVKNNIELFVDYKIRRIS
ncbi:hypothetical protein G7092_28040 [Mucilaginibacter sp. HC2]|uniref:hypothetical protein n=1 Tax=Mucilaginibacter inviolabilis TaxID=2714892 RepID=UPI001407A099|nr:hypothetical protein [Mucilaginibacter inviolabilis]NHA07683.1 hypothetical protein [Mucilaginibacter inviolabilis]